MATRLHTRDPWVQCQVHGVHLVAVPWPERLWAYLALRGIVDGALVRELPVLTLTRMLRETGKRLWLGH